MTLFTFARPARLFLFLLLTSCNNPSSRSAPAQKAPQPADSTRAAASQTLSSTDSAASGEGCTLATPLVPGVPGSPGHLIVSQRNPNGDSELAVHMRTMQADLAAARAAILEKRPIPPMLARHRKIRCAWPTTPSERNEQFDHSAKAYLDAVAGLEKAAPTAAAPAFEQVLNACRACHEQTCSGAIVAIEALRIGPSAGAPQTDCHEPH
jgi:hypothetical protein